MDVTRQILEQIREQGGSDNTNPATLSSSRSLNYANGGTIQRAQEITITSIPLTLNFKDAVGLGVNNTYIKCNLKDIQARFACFEPVGWECARILINYTPDPESDYEEGDIEDFEDLVIVNDYEPASLENSGFTSHEKPKLNVTLHNRGTGNIYQDRDFDAFIIKKTKDPIGSGEQLWCNLNDHFYLGFHARNTKRIPYDVDVHIGEELNIESNIKEGVYNTDYSMTQ